MSNVGFRVLHIGICTFPRQITTQYFSSAGRISNSLVYKSDFCSINHKYIFLTDSTLNPSPNLHILAFTVVHNAPVRNHMHNLHALSAELLPYAMRLTPARPAPYDENCALLRKAPKVPVKMMVLFFWPPLSARSCSP